MQRHDQYFAGWLAGQLEAPEPAPDVVIDGGPSAETLIREGNAAVAGTAPGEWSPASIWEELGLIDTDLGGES